MFPWDPHAGNQADAYLLQQIIQIVKENDIEVTNLDTSLTKTAVDICMQPVPWT